MSQIEGASPRSRILSHTQSLGSTDKIPRYAVETEREEELASVSIFFNEPYSKKCNNTNYIRI
jgi:hypothetical protein